MSEAPFHRSAHIYDVVYDGLDYPAHAATVLAVIRSRCPDAASLLDVACGTGRHLEVWRDEFPDRAGLDLDAAMLERAAARLQDVPLYEAGMEDFDLGRTFDAVTCLFSSIGYTRTEDGLEGAIATMARHVAPGGVLVVEPWLQRETFGPPFIRTHLVEQPDIVVARTSRADPAVGDDNVSDLEFAYLVTTMDGSELITERHLMGMFTPDQFRAALRAAGLDADFDHAGTHLGRGLAIGVRPR